MKEKWVKWKKITKPNPYEHWDPTATTSAGGPQAASARAAGARTLYRSDVWSFTHIRVSRDAEQPGDFRAGVLHAALHVAALCSYPGEGDG